MFRQIGTGEIIVIVVVLVLLFGAKKLPELARSIGRSARELREGLKEGSAEEDPAPDQASGSDAQSPSGSDSDERGTPPPADSAR